MNEKRILPFLALLLVLLAACTVSGGDPPAVATPIVIIITAEPPPATATGEPAATTETPATATIPAQATAAATNTPVPPTAVAVLPTDVGYILARDDVNMRSGPGTGYSIIGWVAAGQTARVTGVSAGGGWWRVVCPDGTTGSCWVTAASQHTQPTQPPGSPPPAACSDAAAFVADVTIPDNTRFAPGAGFVKTWRVRNSGTCTWNSSYALVFKNGEMMTAADSYPLPGTVAPGQSVDLSVSLAAPPAPGTYRGNWQLRNAQGGLFGLRNNASLFVQIIVEAPQQPAPSTIAGVVYQDQNGNAVPDPGEPRASNREIWLMNGTCEGGGAPIATTTSGADGVYTFKGQYAGSYCVGLRSAHGLEDVAVAVVASGQIMDRVHLRVAAVGASINGWLWRDYCSFRSGEGGPVAVDGNCVPDGNGSYRANGLVDSGETGIAGVTIRLLPGPCGTGNPAVHATAVTNGDGHYLFNNLQPGTYCVNMNAAEEPNAGRLLPGDWTYPAYGIWYHTISLGLGEQRTGVNFGWDYQLD